jgi:hypothetical protein
LFALQIHHVHPRRVGIIVSIRFFVERSVVGELGRTLAPVVPIANVVVRTRPSAAPTTCGRSTTRSGR